MNTTLTEDELRWRDEILVELDTDPKRALTHYCHEGLVIEVWGDGWSAGICSHVTYADTRDLALKELIEHVRAAILDGQLGC